MQQNREIVFCLSLTKPELIKYMFKFHKFYFCPGYFYFLEMARAKINFAQFKCRLHFISSGFIKVFSQLCWIWMECYGYFLECIQQDCIQIQHN